MKPLVSKNGALASLVILVVLELTTRYDTWARQSVLALSAAATIAIYLGVAGALSRRWGMVLPPAVAWLAAAGVWFDAAGNFAHLYARVLYWDRIAHLVGAFALAAALTVILVTLEHQGKVRLGRFGLVLFAVSITALLAGLYESSEFIGDRLFDTHRVTDLYDTADDLLWNLGGAVLGAWFVHLFSKPRQNHG